MANATETYEETVEAFWDSQDDPTLSNQEDTVASNTSCTDSCPEQAEVTVEENTIVINGGALKWTLVQNTATKVTATLQVVDEDGDDLSDHYEVDLRFVDSNSAPETESGSPPPTPGWGSKTITTDNSGEYVLVVENTGSTDTWYLVGILGGGVKISAAITIGV